MWSDGLDLADLAAEHGTPLHVVRGDRLDANAAAAMAASESADVFSSYKTNPVPGVLARLHGHGVGAEVISPYELWLAMRLGVPGERIIYNGPAKSPESIRAAIRHDVLLINANSVSEARLIAAIAAEEQRVVNLGLRVTVPGAWIAQFGIPELGAAADAVRAAARRPLGRPARPARAPRADDPQRRDDGGATSAPCSGGPPSCGPAPAGAPTILDLGGSLACPTSSSLPTRQYRLNRALGTDLLPPDPDDCLRIADAARLAAELVGRDAAAGGYAPPRLVLEPGRALTGDTQFLLTRVVDINDGALPNAILDAGINVAEPVTSEYHQLISVTSPGLHATTAYRLAGPICTPADVLYQHWRLPPLTPGHVLAIMDSGAYFVPFSTTFSFPKPAIVLQDGPEITVLRERETYDDMT